MALMVEKHRFRQAKASSEVRYTNKGGARALSPSDLYQDHLTPNSKNMGPTTTSMPSETLRRVTRADIDDKRSSATE